MTKNAIIFSKNEKLSKLVENEMLLIGYNVKTSYVSTIEAQEFFDVIIVDAMSVESSAYIRSFLSNNQYSTKICISTNEEKSISYGEFNKHLSFPFSLEMLRKILLAPHFEENKKNSEKTSDAKCFFVDKDRRGVTVNNTYIPLSQYEFNTLELLCLNSGKCVSRDSIRKILNSSDGNISDVYISHLRSKIEAPLGLKIIYTVRNKGYMTDYTIS